eukprot:666385-Pyramimonas_sp.AAC.1
MAGAADPRPPPDHPAARGGQGLDAGGQARARAAQGQDPRAACWPPAQSMGGRCLRRGAAARGGVHLQSPVPFLRGADAWE